MARSMHLAAALLVVSAAVLTVVPQTEGLTCGNVISYLSTCIPYARGTTTAPSEACCNGVRSLNGAAQKTVDRQTACNCLKKNVASFPGIKLSIVSGIPAKCSVTVPYPISTSVDCSKVS